MQNQNPKIKQDTKRIGRKVAVSPQISVVIPAYNTAEFIGQSLDSVLAQTFGNYEVIVVNDGSPDTDQLEAVLGHYYDEIVYITQQNAGAGKARNTAIEQSRGQFIAFLDSDDIWFPDFLASQLNFLQTKGYDMVYCDAELFGLATGSGKNYMDTAPSSGEADFDSILDSRCNVITSGTLITRSAMEKAGLFECERLPAEDFHLWLRVAKSGSKIGYQGKSLVKYRVRLDSLSGDSANRIKRGIGVFERVRDTIEMSVEQKRRIDIRLKTFDAELSVEHGKMFLLDSNYADAARAFGRANSHKRSLKLTAISLICRIAPELLVRLYRSRRPTDIAFIPNSEKS